jgi:phosphoesterase RecJ-like protein
MYFALKKLNKNVIFVHGDLIPDRYQFLTEAIPKDAFHNSATNHTDWADLALIFDTHDPKLCSPLFELLTENKKPIFFIDHHVKTDYQTDPKFTLIDESASCTGEIVYNLINQLSVPLDANIASSLYSSLVFDTQNFKIIRDPIRPFKMASELLGFKFDHEKIQNQLFASWTISKMNYLSYLIPHVTYLKNNSVAIIKILKTDLKRFNVGADQMSDIVDLFMSIDSVQVAVVIREDDINLHKLSFRSRANHKVLLWAEAFDGGGHNYSAGAWVRQPMSEIETRLQHLIAATDWKTTAS